LESIYSDHGSVRYGHTNAEENENILFNDRDVDAQTGNSRSIDECMNTKKALP